MASTPSLLDAADSAITIERVRALVEQIGPEAPTIDYQAQMSDTIAHGVAALANTYGGLLLVGVTENREITGVTAKTVQAVAEHCQATLEPPWVPPIIPVRLAEGAELYVLVLRVVPGQHPTPLLVDGVAPVRHRNTIHRADWQRLKNLFAQADTGGLDDPWAIQAPSLPPGPNGTRDYTVDLVIRSGLNVPVAREATRRPLSEKIVDAFTDAVIPSPLTTAMASIAMDGSSEGGMERFGLHGVNRSHTVSLAWSCAPGGTWPRNKAKPVEAAIRLMAPGSHGQVNQHLRVEIDVVVRHSTLTTVQGESATDQDVELTVWRITVEQLRDLIDAMLATLTSQDVVASLAQLAGVEPIAVPQPRVLHMVTTRPLADVLAVTGLRLIPDARTSTGVQLLADPTRDLADRDDRHEQVMAWLTQITLEAGLRGIEQLLERLDSAKAR